MDLPSFWDEPFQVTTQGSPDIWTRDTKSGAIALAINITRVMGTITEVRLRETNYLEYTAVPYIERLTT